MNWKAILAGTLIASILAPISFDIGPFHIILQTFILFCLGAILGKKEGAIIAFLYLAIGAMGLPVFGGFTGGWHKLTGPTSGFLWAFPIVVYYIGWACEKGRKTFLHFIIYFFRAHLLWLIPGFGVLYVLLPGAQLVDALVMLIPGILIKTIAGGILSWWAIKKLPPGWTEASVE